MLRGTKKEGTIWCGFANYYSSTLSPVCRRTLHIEYIHVLSVLLDCLAQALCIRDSIPALSTYLNMPERHCRYPLTTCCSLSTPSSRAYIIKIAVIVHAASQVEVEMRQGSVFRVSMFGTKHMHESTLVSRILTNSLLDPVQTRSTSTRRKATKNFYNTLIRWR